ncbi:peptidoglycan/xylan/chitin deacetylase (PgdA/CDA1 family) [Kitasatospora sp. MAP12-15]|uniref:polysaccharide deacetylase family protein n=1 Tax=unclassified Kitasatospora TaxID=2633591 RepID=UPI002475DCDF|nr:polysaccharide deacetylase family protein [Kitasatospora sp. MAP12-44]MDH6115354.1 peptidoglycan/xylan/chitin deacetylase (PgdA/CDA1 family) [Kitasatospora sp. MAP12-44]
MAQTHHSLPRRRFLVAGAATLLTLGAPSGPAAAKSGSRRSSRSLPMPESEVDAGSMVMALTFDDGPSPQYTPQVLDVLRDNGVHATFFVCGDNIGLYPDVLRRIAAEGHTVGNHSWSHPDFVDLSDDYVRDQIQRTQDAVENVVGRAPVLFRAPYGNFTDSTLSICADLGLRPISWSVDPTDWANPGTDTIINRVLAGAATGAIVLNHDGTEGGDDDPPAGTGGDRSQTVAALTSYLPQLISAGYTFTTPDAHPPR